MPALPASMGKPPADIKSSQSRCEAHSVLADLRHLEVDLRQLAIEVDGDAFLLAHGALHGVRMRALAIVFRDGVQAFFGPLNKRPNSEKAVGGAVASSTLALAGSPLRIWMRP